VRLELIEQGNPTCAGAPACSIPCMSLQFQVFQLVSFEKNLGPIRVQIRTPSTCPSAPLTGSCDEPTFPTSNAESKLLIINILVGERRFEPPTPWSRTDNRCTNLLFRLGLFCVLYRLFAWYSGTNGPNLNPDTRVIEPRARPSPGTYRVPELQNSPTHRCLKPREALAIRQVSAA
jgi:hypothetical protein